MQVRVWLHFLGAGCDSRFVTGFGTFEREKKSLMIKQGSSWSIARSALAGSSLAVAALVSVAPVQAHHENATAVVAADSGQSAQAAKANTSKKIARDTKAKKASAHREAHASKSKKSSEEKNPKVAKVEKSKSSSNEDAMNGSSDDPLEGL